MGRYLGDLTNLTNGTTYTFAVSATSNAATGTGSAGSPAVTPEDTIFDFGTPATVDAGDPPATVLGTTFTLSVNGAVTGIRFYKAASNTGTHVGYLWTGAGQLLGSVPFANETASGWQTALFTDPVAVTAGGTYVVSYDAPNGHYSATGGGFTSAVTNGPLAAVADGATPNGVYTYGSANSFPSNTYNSTNYWVDVLFAPSLRASNVRQQHMKIRTLLLAASACLTMGALAGCGGSSSGTTGAAAGGGLTAPATGGSGRATQFAARPSRATPENSNPDIGQASSQVGAHPDTVRGASNVATRSAISDPRGRAKSEARYASGSHDRITSTGSVQRARSTPAASSDDNQRTRSVALDPCRLLARSQAQAIAGEPSRPRSRRRWGRRASTSFAPGRKSRSR